MLKWVTLGAGEPLHTDGRGMEEGEALLPQPKKQPPSKRYTNEVLYGIINAIVGAPTMISFAAIVYQVGIASHGCVWAPHAGSCTAGCASPS